MPRNSKTQPTRAVMPPETSKPAAVVAKKVQKRRGRKQERKQISVRIDKVVMDLAHKQIERAGMRITDLIERGLMLALRELGDTTPIHHHARLILHDEGVEFSRFVMDANILLRFPEVRKLSALEKVTREHILAIVKDMRTWPDAHEVVNLMGLYADRDRGPKEAPREV